MERFVTQHSVCCVKRDLPAPTFQESFSPVSVMVPRVRFAPSPTGFLHVGGARTALFNYLFARNQGGVFTLRIEDTDLERSTQESVQQILDSMSWMGLESDEPVVYQTHLVERHRACLKELADRGLVYRCYCPKDRLDQLRAEANAQKKAFVYRPSLLAPGEMERFRDAGESGVWRLSVPEGRTQFLDLVYGPKDFDNSTQGDFVVAKADGSPLFNFCNPIDDHDMGITHVIRGEDHVSNTPKQVLIYQALGFPVPIFAHLPLINGRDKQPLSKRHGAVSVMQFHEDGFLPEALVNFLALLGWSPEGEFDEIMTLEELASKFSLEKVNRSPAVFDHEKLMWMNGMHIRRRPFSVIEQMVSPRVAAVLGPVPEVPARTALLDGESWQKAAIALEFERSRTLNEFSDSLDFFWKAPESYEEKPAKKFFSTEEQHELFRSVIPVLCQAMESALMDVSHLRVTDAGAVVYGDRLEEMPAKAMEPAIRTWAELKGVKLLQVLQPVRLALTGRSASPPLFEIMILLGWPECLRRLERALERLKPQKS
jgi:glutamyl-tRNA synthetase